MPYNLLHISDLHRAQSDPIENSELLASLLADRDRMALESPAIEGPDAIVVTGDLVHGARLGDPGYAAELDSQYAVAEDFLVRLADEFLAGDRSRLAIVPGNHDVDWNGAKAAMEPVPEGEMPDGFSLALCGPAADLRWSWPERRAYRIVGRDLYGQRLARFDALVNSFYEGVGIVNEPLYRMHSLHNDQIVIVAFDSCVGNDCFAFHGLIAEEAMANAYLDLRQQPFQLCIAAWHHSIEGESAATDYMSPSTVEGLIGKGFRLGLHGHQHRAAAASRYLHLPVQEVMAVVSAGSLCAGPGDLPPGVTRQYNLIEIANDLCSARVHPREMVIGHNFAPSRRPEFGLASFVELEWKLPETQARRRREYEARLVVEAEQAIAAGAYPAAEEVLGRVSTEASGYARSLLVTALKEQDAWDRLAELLAEPAGIAELVDGVTALLELRDYVGAEEYLDRYWAEVGLSAALSEDLRANIAVRRKLK